MKKIIIAILVVAGYFLIMSLAFVAHVGLDKWTDRWYRSGYENAKADCADAGCSWGPKGAHEMTVQFGWPATDNR